MSSESWNVFDFFVYIETKINFSAEFLFADDPRLESRQDQLREAESLADSGCRCYEQYRDTSLAIGFGPSAAEAGERRIDASRGEHRSLFSNFLVPTCTRHDDFIFNLYSYGFLQNQRPEMRHLKSARHVGVRRRFTHRLTSDSAHPADRSREAHRPPLLHLGHTGHQLHNIDEGRVPVAQALNHTKGQLLILSLNLIVVFGFIVRLTLHSTRKIQPVSAHRAQNISAHGAVEQLGKKHMSWLTFWQEHLMQALCSDLFANFTNRRMVNMVVVGSLVPSAVLRLLRIQRYLRLCLLGWARGLISARRGPIGSRWASSSTCTSERGAETSPLASMERLNIVQTDLCYLKSLRTSSLGWYEMLTKSWFHKHKCGNFLEEREMLTKFCRSADKSGHQSALAACDLITKMYYYNLINFDSCFVSYFRPPSGLRAALANNEETMASGHLRLAVGSAPKGGERDQEEQFARVDCDAGRKESSSSGEAANRDIFVARPLHRMDVTEMGWLLVALGLLYGLGAFTLTWQALFSFLNETNLRAFSDISPNRMLLELRQFVTTFALTRWLLINVLDVIIILTIFDLYQFFACCLICLSRARYLMFRLSQMSEYCQATSQLLEQEQRLLDKFATRQNRANSLEIADELAALANPKQRPRSARQRKRADQKATRLSPASISAVRELNIELKFMMNLIVIVQQELSDLKRFFSLYLNLELTFKSLCMTFSICALFDSSNVFESCYLLTVFNTCTTPIFITMITAALIENEFKGVCRNLDRIIITGGPIMSVSNLRQVIQLASFLSSKGNRSFVVVGNFSFSLRSLVPMFAWIATGVVMIRRDRA